MLRLDIHAILIYKQYDISQIQFKKKKSNPCRGPNKGIKD